MIYIFYLNLILYNFFYFYLFSYFHIHAALIFYFFSYLCYFTYLFINSILFYHFRYLFSFIFLKTPYPHTCGNIYNFFISNILFHIHIYLIIFIPKPKFLWFCTGLAARAILTRGLFPSKSPSIPISLLYIMNYLIFRNPLSKRSQLIYKQNILNHHSSLMHSKILNFYLFLRPLRVALYRILKYTQK